MTFSLGENIIDSRDVIDRIEELEVDEYRTEREDNELEELRELAGQLEGYGDWAYGETLILDDHFEAYAEELAGDIGAIDRDAKWPLTHIDWEAAADALKQDYMSADVDGYTYWMRA